MISIRNISKSFKKKRGLKDIFLKKKENIKVLNNLSMEIENNKITSIFGANGSGKTTLFKILAGYVPYDSGYIEIDNISLRNYLNSKNIFLITSDGRSFYYRLTIIQNLKFFMGIWGVEFDQNRVETLLDQLSLLKKKDSFFYELSTGMIQRLSFLRAILLKPDILLLDEVERGIDNNGLDKIFSMIKNFNNVTTIFSTHNKELLKFSYKTINIDGGI